MWHRPAVSIVFIVHDDVSLRESLGLTIPDPGWQSETFASARAFLALRDRHPQRTGRPADALELGHHNEYQNVVEVCYQITLPFTTPPFMEIRFSSFPSNQLAYPAA
jgi:hypothetical protein